MKKILGVACLSMLLGAAAWACSSDESEVTPKKTDTTPSDDDKADDDAIPDDDGGVTEPGRSLILATLNGTSESETVTFDEKSGSIAGRYKFQGRAGAAAVVGGRAFVLAQFADKLVLLDAKDPTKEVSSWNLAGNDMPDGGEAEAQPVSVAVDEARKVAYVARYRRNRIAVLDLANPATAVKYIDLAKYLQGIDSDKVLDATALVYGTKSDKVYVLAGNVDFSNVAGDGFTYKCSALKTKLVSIDAKTDATAEVATLNSHNPPVGAPIVFDDDESHLFALGAGCDIVAPDGGSVATKTRGIDRIDLAAGTSKVVVAMNGEGFPVTFARQGPTLFVSTFFGGVKSYDDTTGAPKGTFADAPDAFAVESGGSFVGLKQSRLPDGGTGPYEIVRTGADGGTSTLAAAPFTLTFGFPGGIVKFTTSP